MLYLLKKDIKELFRNKKRIVILITVLIIFIISTYSNVSNPKVKEANMIQFGLADEDGSVYSKMLIEYFRESESFASYVNIREGTGKELEQSFYQGELDLFLQIPEGFAENMIVMNHLPVKVLISTKDVTKSVLLKNILDSYEKYIRAVEVNCAALYDVMAKAGMNEDLINKTNVEISYDLIFTALGKEKLFDYLEISEFPAANLFTYYNFALLSIILNFTGLYAGFLMLQEKRKGILKRLYTTGTGVFTVLCEKVLFAAGVVFLLCSCAYLLPGIINGSKISLGFLLTLFCASLFSICLSVFLSSLYYKTRDYIIAGNFLCFLLSILGGGIIPIMYLPEVMVKLSVFTPNYWLIRVMLLLWQESGRELVNWYLLITLAGSMLLFILSAFLYKREEVYYEE